jgi:hypothetical protein
VGLTYISFIDWSSNYSLLLRLKSKVLVPSKFIFINEREVLGNFLIT